MRTTDKYGFRTMDPGESRIVAGAEPKNAQQMLYRFRERIPEINGRKFVWWKVADGLRIQRVS